MVRCRASRARQGETPPMRLWRSLTAWLPSILRPSKDQTESPTLPEVGGRPLRLRLLFWIILWLLPAAAVSVVQGFDRVQRDVADVRERLIQTARATASDEESVFSAGGQVLSALANQPEVRMGTEQCSTALTNAIKGLTYISNILRFDAQGNVSCAALRAQVEPENVT